jgi:hypothetical protein
VHRPPLAQLLCGWKDGRPVVATRIALAASDGD